MTKRLEALVRDMKEMDVGLEFGAYQILVSYSVLDGEVERSVLALDEVQVDLGDGREQILVYRKLPLQKRFSVMVYGVHIGYSEQTENLDPQKGPEMGTEITLRRRLLASVPEVFQDRVREGIKSELSSHWNVYFLHDHGSLPWGTVFDEKTREANARNYARFDYLARTTRLKKD